MDIRKYIIFQIPFFLLTYISSSFGKDFNKQKKSISLKTFNHANLDTKENWKKEYNKALTFFKNGQYIEANKIFDDIIPLMVLSEEIIDARLKQAYCSFYNDDFISSIYQFEKFYNDYKNTKFAEEALYMLGLSNSKVSGSIHHDQNHTEEAVYIFKNYLKQYPNGKYRIEAKNNLDLMLTKIFEKELDIVDTYYILEYYSAAKKILDDFIDEIPNNDLAIKARWLKLNILYYDAYYSKTEWPKWVEAMTYCLKFISDYTANKYTKKANKIYKKIEKSIIKLEGKT